MVNESWEEGSVVLVSVNNESEYQENSVLNKFREIPP